MIPRARRRAVLCIALLACLGAARAGAGELESPLVRAGVAAYEALNYPRAVSLLERARRAPLLPEERAMALRTLGAAKVVLGDERGAREAFTELLRLAPATTLEPLVSPKIRLVFEEVRAQLAEARAAEARPPAAADGGAAADKGPAAADRDVAAAADRGAAAAADKGAPLTPGAAGRATPPAPLAVRVEPAAPTAGAPAFWIIPVPAGSARVQVATRAAGDAAGGAYHVRSLYPPAGATVRAQLPAELLTPPALEYFVVALSAAGAEVGRAGDPARPLRVPVGAARVPAYRKGWLWGLVGGVGAAAILAGVLGGVLTRPGTLVIR